jgi:integrase
MSKNKKSLEMTDVRIDKLKIGKECNLIDGHPVLTAKATRIFYNQTGLYLEITKTGKKMFRFVYRQEDGKQKTMTIGEFSRTGNGETLFTIEQAHQKYLEAKGMIKVKGIDPAKERKKLVEKKRADEQKNKRTFKIVFLEWLENPGLTIKNPKGFTETHKKKIFQKVEKHCRILYSKPFHEIKESDLRDILEELRPRKQDAARRLYASFRQIFQYGRIKKYIDSNPMELVLTREFPAVKNERFRHSLDLITLQKILRLIESNSVGEIQTQTALKLAPLLFTRPTELRLMRWSDIDFERRIWSTHKSKILGREVASQETQDSDPDFFVPLSEEAVRLIRQLERYRCSDYVFAVRGDAGAPSDSTFSKALRKLLEKNGLKGEQTVHGFRHVVRSLAPAKLAIPTRIIEQQMSHSEIAKSSDLHFYDQNLYIPERRAFMDVWSGFIAAIRDDYREYYQDELDELKKSGKDTKWSESIEELKVRYRSLSKDYEQATKFRAKQIN